MNHITMKRIRHLTAALFTAALLVYTLCAGASAEYTNTEHTSADDPPKQYAPVYTPIAEELAAFGMFRGTSRGFELDRAPTRAEAAIMLVRLYSAEEEASAAYAAGEISHPFQDVSAFTAPYVAWLYGKGCVKGISETLFGSQNPCSLRHYTAFLLRALGYEDGTDFQYADALSFAESAGIRTSDLPADLFLRDHLVLLTCRGLSALMKGEQAPAGTRLMQSLFTGRTDSQNWIGIQRYVEASVNGKAEIAPYALPREESGIVHWKPIVTGSGISYLCRNPKPAEECTALPEYAVTWIPEQWALSELENHQFGGNDFSEWTYARGEYGRDVGRIVFKCQNLVDVSPAYHYQMNHGRFVDISGRKGEFYTGFMDVEYEGETYHYTHSLLFWETEDGCLCTLYGDNAADEELLTMARSVRKYDGEPLNPKPGWIPRGYVEDARISVGGSVQVEWGNYLKDRLVLTASPIPVQKPDRPVTLIKGDGDQPDLEYRPPMFGEPEEEAPPTVTVNGKEVDATEPVNVGGAVVSVGSMAGWQWMNTLSWEDSGIYYQLRGLLSRDQLEQIARSIH